MPQPKPQAQPSSLNLHDIFYVLFRHKWKIITCSLIGFGAAAAVFLLYPTVYESQAKLLVRYVVDRSAVDQVDSKASTGPAGENLILSEAQILGSWDLAMQVASAVGVERLVPGSQGTQDLSLAARNIQLGLTVAPIPGTNVIQVSYRNRDPELATLVLKELVTRYFTKHLEVHRSADAFNFVSQQSDEVRGRLRQTEDELKRLKDQAGVLSLTESTTNLNAELAKTREALSGAETERAEQQAVLGEMDKPLPGQDVKSQNGSSVASTEVLQQYQNIITRLASLRETDLDLISRYAQKTSKPSILDEIQRTRQVRSQADQLTATAQPGRIAPRPTAFVGADRDEAQSLARERYRRQNDSGFSYQGTKKSFDTLVKEAEHELIKQKIDKSLIYKASDDELARLAQLQTLNQQQIDNLEKQRKELEQKYPGLAATLPSARPEELQAARSAERARVTALAAEQAKLAGITARIQVLDSHLDDARKRIQQLSELAPQIEQLERTKEIEENNYKYFQASLEKARIDEALDPSKMPNISVVQSPSIAMKTSREVKKIVLGFAGGGIALGLGFAFLIDLMLDRTVKRPLEIEMLLGMPPMLSIPYFRKLKSWTPRLPGKSSTALQKYRDRSPEPWEPGHFIRSFAEAVRDRLILYFLLNRLNHKPKLVAVTGCSEGAGTSTVAAGLAAALSETGEGKVLIVDMNIRGPEVHPFFRGTPGMLADRSFGRRAGSGWGEPLSGGCCVLRRARCPDHSQEVLRSGASSQGQRLRLYYFRHAAAEPDKHYAFHSGFDGQGFGRCGRRKEQSRLPKARVCGTSRMPGHGVRHLQQGTLYTPKFLGAAI